MSPVPIPEVELLLQCARTRIDDDRAAAILGLVHHGLDWDSVIPMARRHRLTPLLYRALFSVAPDEVPPGVLQTLRAVYEGNRFRNLFLVHELIDALRALDAEGVRAIPYKGPALAAGLYQDLALRQGADLDLLVRPADALTARRVLLGMGLQQIRPRPGHVRWMEAAHVGLHYEFRFQSRDGQVCWDLNWRIAPWFFRLPDLPDSAWDRLGRVALPGISAPCLAPEDLLIVLCLHACKHRWEELKWIVDVAELLRTYPGLDWGAVTSRVERAGCATIVALGLLLASDLLDAHLPAQACELVRRSPSAAALAGELYGHLLVLDARMNDVPTRLAFVASSADRLDTKWCCRLLPLPYFLLTRVVRPGMAALRRAAAG
jgi:hypothetical protein